MAYNIIPTRKVKRVVREARLDSEFLNEIIDADPDAEGVIYSHRDIDILITYNYYGGWVLAKRGKEAYIKK